MNDATGEAMRRARLARDRLDRELRDIDEVTMVDIGLAEDAPAAAATDRPAEAGVVLQVHVRTTPAFGLPRHWDGFEVVVVVGDYHPEATPQRTKDHEEEDPW